MKWLRHPLVVIFVGMFAISIIPVSSSLSPTLASQLETGPVIAKELTGLTWDGREFIASYGEATSVLVNVSLDGHGVTPFAQNFTGRHEIYAAQSQGKAGFPQGYLYVNSDPSIYEFTPTGSSWRLFSTPPGSSRISYVAFDTVGTWGYLLFALDDNGLLWSIKADGTAKVLQNFSNFGKGGALKPEGIAVAPQSFGGLGGDLIITLEGATRVLAIPPNDTSQVSTIAQFPGEEPERVLVIPPQSDLYVAEWGSGAIYKLPAANLSGYAGSLMVITEGENEPNGTFTVLQAAGNNVTKTRIGTVPGSPHFEGATFVPTSFSSGSSTSSSTLSGTSSSISSGTTSAIPDSALIVGAGLLVGAAIFTASVVLRHRRNRI